MNDDGKHANNPYRVVYTPESDHGDFQLVEGSMHSEYATFVSASELLHDEQWSDHLRRADCEWLVPFLHRFVDDESVSSEEILLARDHHRARRWAERTGSMTRDDERELAATFGLPPNPETVPAIRQALRVELERTELGGSADTVDWPSIRFYCVALFAHGDPVDAPLVWRARDAAPAVAGGIDVELLCGGGLERTLAALRADGSVATDGALESLSRAVAESVFDDWTPVDYLTYWRQYYGVGGDE
ncbi:hypothetical protein [Natronoglomus mannanivorans]|uniref:Uncharacterized protein n=1 Tax=Natronoglomus mannanivorans TaxID=2979990 RepID=A0AAP2Z2V3_9EURY|nr:hypothetical protein [Halobacteria archaeon AArc-xg1-1]